MKDSSRKLLKQARGGEMRGGDREVPELREALVDRIVGSRKAVSGTPGSVAVLKMSLAGAAVALGVALGVTLVVLDNRQEAAATVWSDVWIEEEQ